MPLMLGGGDSKPYIRFSPSINSWEMSGAEGREEFTWDAPVVFDVHGLQLGWMKIDSMGREWAPWPSRDQRLPQPSEEHKIGFAINVVSSKLFGEESVREFSANTFGNLMFIQDLYNNAEQAPEFKEGKVPVVQITGSKAQKIGKGTTRIPEFEIKKWVDRPAELSSPQAELPQTSATSASAPVAPAPAPAEDDEF
jgi:hypothetical protein